jgi:hypothetical protein
VGSAYYLGWMGCSPEGTHPTLDSTRPVSTTELGLPQAWNLPSRVEKAY